MGSSTFLRCVLCLGLVLGTARSARAEEADVPTMALADVDLALGEGDRHVRVAVEPGSLTSIAVFGDRDALQHFEVIGVAARDPLSEDGLLPRVASFVVPADVDAVELDLTVKSPVTVVRVSSALVRELPKEGEEPQLIGMPSPALREDGYLLERPNRYQFARPDVASTLLEAFRDTRLRYRRDPIAIGDITQWNGKRPALDLGSPRHVSHDGGRDVDIGLPSIDEPSTVRDHCDRAVAKDYAKAWCKPGTARYLDASRLAYLLGRLARHGAVEKIFLDGEFIGPTWEAAQRLVAQGVLSSKVLPVLSPEAGIFKHLPWHTDHVHVRFLGARGATPFRE